MNIRFGYRNMEFPSADIIELRDNNDLLGDAPALHERMNEDGYLLLAAGSTGRKYLAHVRPS